MLFINFAKIEGIHVFIEFSFWSGISVEHIHDIDSLVTDVLGRVPVVVFITVLFFGAVTWNDIISSDPDDFIACILHDAEQVRLSFTLQVMHGAVAGRMWI